MRSCFTETTRVRAAHFPGCAPVAEVVKQAVVGQHGDNVSELVKVPAGVHVFFLEDKHPPPDLERRPIERQSGSGQRQTQTAAGGMWPAAARPVAAGVPDSCEQNRLCRGCPVVMVDMSTRNHREINIPGSIATERIRRLAARNANVYLGGLLVGAAGRQETRSGKLG